MVILLVFIVMVGRLANPLRSLSRHSPLICETKTSTYLFTSGGTEVTITAIIGYCLRHQERENISLLQLLILCLRLSDYLVQHFGFEANYHPTSKSRNNCPANSREALCDDTISFPPCMLIMKQVASTYRWDWTYLKRSTCCLSW